MFNWNNTSENVGHADTVNSISKLKLTRIGYIYGYSDDRVPGFS